jgi:3-hydroxyacyl-CoA dehydrogenase
VDFVVEAVPERMEIKQAVFAELDAVTPGHAILASNTSALSISEMAEATSRPDKVVGFHFFYPASVMRLIEVIEGEETSEETLRSAANFAQTIRKTAIRCGEVPGFVVNRILNSGVSEIWRVVEEEDLDTGDVDKLVQESKAAPMGPFFLSDLLGLDTVLHVAEHLRDSYGDRFYVSSRMKELVQAGDLGQKTGKGFYEHGS